MNLDNSTLTPDLGAAPLVPETTGQLNLRPEILEGFLSVRQQVEQLQSLLHQVMRRVALPRCREIGNELIRIRNFYPKGRTGPGGVSSGFYRDAEAVTGLKKRSLQGYISIAESWGRLMDYMADLPEGATPITSLRAALEAITAMKRPLSPAAQDDAIDVEATAGDDSADSSSVAMKRSNFASGARKVFDQQFMALKAVSVLTTLQRERLGKIQEMLQLLLDDIDQSEADAAVPAVVTAPAIDFSNVATTQPSTPYRRDWVEPEATSEQFKLTDLYPLTPAGLEKLEADLLEHGSGAALGRHLGNTSKNPSRFIAAHRDRIKKAVEDQ